MLLVSSWIVALTLTSPLPPSFRCSLFHPGYNFGWKPPCIVRSFHVLTSVASISSCGQLIIPVGYRMTGSAYMLMAWILFLPLSWLLRTCLTLWRYLAVAGLLASSSWLPLACRIPRYL
ncbi:hypothetical protein LDENG_00284900 [Lucifuga dentata]|nr:hypothetical protein LDENG_00284900 [Lucifuga dentata]